MRVFYFIRKEWKYFFIFLYIGGFYLEKIMFYIKGFGFIIMSFSVLDFVVFSNEVLWIDI